MEVYGATFSVYDDIFLDVWNKCGVHSGIVSYMVHKVLDFSGADWGGGGGRTHLHLVAM